MEKFYEKYLILIIIFGISIVSIGTSLVLLKGSGFNALKRRVSATIIDSVPSGSTITDVEFYSELVDSYNAEKGTSYGYDHVFTTAELASLETLSIDEQGPNYHGHPVQDLSGLTYLTGLENLSLRNINVSAIDLSHNTNLETLVIHATGITNVDLSANNSITSVDTDIPGLTRLSLVGANALTSFDANLPYDPFSGSGPLPTASLVIDKGRDVSYLLGGSAKQDETIADNSLGITCAKYNLTYGETTNCYVKGKTTAQMNAVIFKLQQDNEYITISDEAVVDTQVFQGSDKYQLYGSVPMGEFNIVSFKVTAVAQSGISKISLVDYDSKTPKGYVDTVEYDYAPVTAEISKTIYIGKYSVNASSSAPVTTGKIQTNYSFNVVTIPIDGPVYYPAYTISVLGDVKADGIIDIRDVAKAYSALSVDGGDYSAYTEAEKIALDKNNDGKRNALDLIKIYDDKD